MPLKLIVDCGETDIGNNYVITGDVTFNNADTELGFVAKGDIAQKHGYVLSLNPKDSHFNLIKLSPSSPGGFVNLATLHVNGLTFTSGTTYKMAFELNGASITGRLYDSQGNLKATITPTAPDSNPYTDCAVGTWAWEPGASTNQRSAIEGTWSNLLLSRAFPALTASSSSTLTQTADSGGVYVKDNTGQSLQMVAGVGPSGIRDNCTVEGNVTFLNTVTEMGLVARSNSTATQCYAPLDPSTNYLNLLKLDPKIHTPLPYTVLANADVTSSLTNHAVSIGDTFRMSLDVNGGGIIGRLYNSTGGIIQTLTAVDNGGYTSGLVGTWAWRSGAVGNAIEGRWSNLQLNYSSAGGAPYELTLLNGKLFYAATDAACGPNFGRPTERRRAQLASQTRAPDQAVCRLPI